MNTSELLSALIIASERAGNIARICRLDENLLSLLVQEKKDSEKNPSKTLSEALYSPVEVSSNIENDLPQLPNNLGVWIDPIDSTAEYIRGGLCMEQDFILSGLPCVTVLLGVFDMDSGNPLIGVINQPFYKEESNGSVSQSRISKYVV
ncbi:unnamed protein product [Nezara viridula]|uniref:inositol-1,4-bisphosphate 1-phosphatase n=1 Tax=Nezara viridula TaxID=85310 RepID=A0A9P0MR09_NEZVI|nr:unnamed protein product [Nezara viridula]